MPRHADKRLRLTRLAHGYDKPAPGTKLVGGPRFDNACNCGMPFCSWTPAKQREAEQGYQRRKGSWQSADGRFTLTWVMASSRASNSHREGGLRMWDRGLMRESWHTGVKKAREEMARQYEKAERKSGG